MNTSQQNEYINILNSNGFDPKFPYDTSSFENPLSNKILLMEIYIMEKIKLIRIILMIF